MDMIFNHSGLEHPWTSDMPSKDWLNLTPTPGGGFHLTSYKLTPVLDPYASKVDLRETVDGWFVTTMPDLNQRNPHLMTYLIQNSKWWIETVGIDGIRMDTYPYADADGMARWMKELDDEYPNFNTVGETWVTEPAYTAAWQKDSKLSDTNSYLKTVMDFSFFDKLSQAKNEETDAWWNGLNRLYNSFVYDYLYPNPSSVMAFIDNHDTDRFLGNGCDSLMLKQALALLLTVNRIPQLYYGTEILMNGTKEVTDGNVRKDFPGGFPGEQRPHHPWHSDTVHSLRGRLRHRPSVSGQSVPHRAERHDEACRDEGGALPGGHRLGYPCPRRAYRSLLRPVLRPFPETAPESGALMVG